MNFNNFSLIESHIENLSGYIESSLMVESEKYGGSKVEDYLLEEEPLNGEVYRKIYNISYLQKLPNTKYKKRFGVVTQKFIFDEQNEEILLDCDLNLQYVSETLEGDTKVTTGFAGEDIYYPFCFSLYGHVERNPEFDENSNNISWNETGDFGQSGCTPLDYSLNEIDESGDAFYWRKRFYKPILVRSGFQNLLAAWARANEGDFVDLAVEYDHPMYGLIEVAKFTDKITIFGTNPIGTNYPPSLNPAMSWMPSGTRLRIDYYKLAENDLEYISDTKGPFIDIDIFTQRER